MRRSLLGLPLLLVACGDVQDDTRLIAPNACGLPLVSGPCEAAIPAFGFDGDLGRCVGFTYGGCGGNANRFDSLAECLAACGGGGAAVCGGLAGLACADAEVCDFTPDTCGSADAEGICRPRPEVCTKEYAPVCGCDGQTYSNLCHAHAAGVDAAASGPCEVPPRACGGRSGQTCDASSFCDFPADGCDYADRQGICRPRPDACPDIYAPVCGCDGQTYGNLCEAQAAGVDAAQSGACEEPTQCADRSQDPILVGGGTRFGFCVGDCVNEIRFYGTLATSPAECDRVELTVRARATTPALAVTSGTLTPAGHAALRSTAQALVGVPLVPTYGCPDCNDGGSATVELRRGGVVSAHTFEFFNPPPELADADALVRDMIDHLRACQPSRYVIPEPTCSPR